MEMSGRLESILIDAGTRMTTHQLTFTERLDRLEAQVEGLCQKVDQVHEFLGLPSPQTLPTAPEKSVPSSQSAASPPSVPSSPPAAEQSAPLPSASTPSPTAASPLVTALFTAPPTMAPQTASQTTALSTSNDEPQRGHKRKASDTIAERKERRQRK